MADIARMDRTKTDSTARTDHKFASAARTGHKFNAYKSPSFLCHNASNMSKPLIVDLII